MDRDGSKYMPIRASTDELLSPHVSEGWDDSATQSGSPDLGRNDEKRSETWNTAHNAEVIAQEALQHTQSLRNRMKGQSELRQEFEENKEKEKKTLRRWYPWVLWSIAVNFFLWLALCYAIFKASDYRDNRGSYIAISLVVFFTPLLIASFLIFSPRPASMHRGLKAFAETSASPTLKNLVNVTSATICFAIVVIYLYASAIPEYNHPQWAMDVDFANDLPIPAIAISLQTAAGDTEFPLNIATGADAMFATVYDGTTLSSEVFPPEGMRREEHKYGDAIWVSAVANSSVLNRRFTVPTANSVRLTVSSTYNSSIDNSSTSLSGLSYRLAVFDPRLSIDDMLRCGLVPWRDIQAFSDNSFTITTSYITDKLRTLSAPAVFDKAYNDSCTRLYRDRLSEDDPPFAFYEMAVTSTSVGVNNTNPCDVALDPNGACATSVRLTYGTQFVVTRKTVRGIDELTIWVNMGALVGAVQFFAWFILQAVGG